MSGFYLYAETSISPEQLIAAAQAVMARWPNARLHKNDTTCNLTIHVDDEMVGQIDLLDATLDDFDA